MQHTNYKEAVKQLKLGTPASIETLESILDMTGFKTRIKTSELNFSHWYNQHIGHNEYDQTNYLAAYSKGFVRINKSKQFIAAYGIVDDYVFNMPMYKKSPPHHFFFMQDDPELGDTQELVEFLVKKAEYSPGNPATQDPVLDLIGEPKSEGNPLAQMALFTAWLTMGNIAAHYIPAINEIYNSTAASLTALSGILVTNSMIISTKQFQNFLKKKGFEDYKAPAKSSRAVPEYGIKGLERFHLKH